MVLLSKQLGIPTTTSSSSHANALEVTRIEQLKLAGVDSNYLDWAFIVQLHLQVCEVGHVLVRATGDQPPCWLEDNITFCSVITKTVHASIIVTFVIMQTTRMGCGLPFEPLTRTLQLVDVCTGSVS